MSRWPALTPHTCTRIGTAPWKLRRLVSIGVCLIVGLLITPQVHAAVTLRTIPVGVGHAPRAAFSSELPVIPLETSAELLGASWQGSTDHIMIRVRRGAGLWGPWMTLTAEVAEGPDATSDEFHGAAIHRVPTPVWVGHATNVMVRVPRGATVHHLNIIAVDAPRQTGDATMQGRVALPSGRQPTAPQVQTRAQWGADESIRRANPSYADGIVAAVVHHTVNGNTYARGDVPAIIRGIYAYHVKTNGWNDIGYNFLIDRFGRVWEGRYGGITKAVIGAHTGGFNTHTTGMALIGDFTSTSVSAAARSALTQLISWRLDLDHVDPSQSATLTSGGNDKWPAGTIVHARAVGGHRDLYSTACPGTSAYSIINRIRNRAWLVGGPKIAGVSATHTLNPDGSPAMLRVQAHANSAVDWTLIATRISTAATLATLHGTGANVDLTWDGSGAAGVEAWDIRWELQATSGALTARSVSHRLVTTPPPPKLTLITRSAAVATPNGDGRDDAVSISVSVAAAARVRVRIEAAEGVPGITLRTLTNRMRSAGHFTVSWDGTDALGAPLPDGPYLVQFTAEDAVASRSDQTLTVAVGVDRTIRMLPVASVFSPNGDRQLDTVTVRTIVDPSVLTGTLSLRTKSGTIVREFAADAALHGALSTGIDGTTNGTTPIPDGQYVITLRVSGRPVGTVVIRQPLIIDRALRRCAAHRRTDGTLELVVRERTRIRASVRHGSSSRVVTRWFSAGRHVTRAFPGVRVVYAMDAAHNRATLRVTR